MAGTVSGHPEPKDFGVTPEQVAAYRPPDPRGLPPFRLYLLHLSACAIIVLLSWATFSYATKIPDWLRWLKSPLMLLGMAAEAYGMFLVFCLLAYVPPAISWLVNPPSVWLSHDVRCHIESYLCAKAEYERALRQAELERRRHQEDYWRNLSGRDFETEMARLYRADGYAVETTPVTGDEGADLLLRRDAELIVVQCKRQDKPVGPHIVRDLYGTIHHFRANRAFLDSTGGFTEGVRQYVHGKPIELHDLNYILSLQERLSRNAKPQKTLICPNKNLPAWEDLVHALGNETDAMIAFIRHGHDIPDVETAKKLLKPTIKPLGETPSPQSPPPATEDWEDRDYI